MVGEHEMRGRILVVSPQRSRANTSERLAVAELPDLSDRIDAMGLTQEYVAFRDRFLGWRSGLACGARGELNISYIVHRSNPYGFGYWYPTKEVWNFRRTLSYWIAVTFFEGSIFFAVSSFCFCYPEALGEFKDAMTSYGYLAGKANFLICTYFMCLEAINLTATERTSSTDESELVAGASETPEPNNTFRYWPFCYRTSLANLERLGSGPWPYLAAVTYFVGVNTFLVGFITEFSPLPQVVIKWTVLISFLLGSICFVVGGVAECIENGVFTSLKCNTGWYVALLNLIGGTWYLLGSILNFFDGASFWGSFSFGVGSLVFVVGSAALVVMWKDEQFGLSFLAAINNLGGPNGRPLVLATTTGSRTVEEEATFSWRGSLLIMVYVCAAVVSVYNFFLSLADIGKSGAWTSHVIECSFNALLPCILAHALLGLNSAVIKPPKGKPFRQLYIGSRFLAVLMAVSGTAQIVETLMGHGTRSLDPPLVIRLV